LYIINRKKSTHGQILYQNILLGNIACALGILAWRVLDVGVGLLDGDESISNLSCDGNKGNISMCMVWLTMRKAVKIGHLHK
jgi:hypothetical protein